MQRRYVVGLAVAVLVTVVYFGLQSSDLLAPVTDYIFVVASGICSVFAFLVIRHWGFRGKFGFVHLGLFLGIFLWFLGDTTWTVYETVLKIEVPYPSIADVFYLGAYIPLAIGIAQFVWTFRASFNRQRIVVALGIGLLIVGLTYAFLIGPLVGSTEDLLTKTFDVTYPVLDSILVVLAIFMFLVFRGGRVASAWVWISLGLLLAGLYDIAFGLGNLQGWYYSGNPIELIQLWAYIVLALGFDEQRGAAMAG